MVLKEQMLEKIRELFRTFKESDDKNQEQINKLIESDKLKEIQIKKLTDENENLKLKVSMIMIVKFHGMACKIQKTLH